MAFMKVQYIPTIDVWTLADIYGITEHRKQLEVYTYMNLYDPVIHLFALDIAKYAGYKDATESDIADIMNRICEYIVIEYEPY